MTDGGYEWVPRPPNLRERIGMAIFLAVLLLSVFSSAARWRLFGDYDERVGAGLACWG